MHTADHHFYSVHPAPPSRSGYRLLLATCCLLLSACSAVGPDYRIPEQAIIQQADTHHVLSGADQTIYSHTELPAHWWHLYHDETLNHLIETALHANTDLRVAAANLRAARAVAGETEHQKIPHIGLNVAPGYGRPSAVEMGLPFTLPDSGYYDAGMKISYQVDLFGKLARAIESATADAEATQAAYDMSKIVVAADTAHAYADLCSSVQLAKIGAEAVALQEQYVKSTADRVRIGRGTALDNSRALAQLAQIKSQLPVLQAMQRTSRYRISALLGEIPGSGTAETLHCEQAPRITSLIPIGDGRSLLQRRPDIRKAERSLASATARIGVATADLYPNIQFGISAGSTGLLPGFGNGDAFRWGLGPLVSWSLPVTSTARLKIEQAEAGSEGALARFDAIVLAALKETDSALSIYAQELDRHRELLQLREQTVLSATQAEQLFHYGRADYLFVLDARRNVVNAENALASSDAALSADQITLFLALGGGWEELEKTDHH